MKQKVLCMLAACVTLSGCGGGDSGGGASAAPVQMTFSYSKRTAAQEPPAWASVTERHTWNDVKKAEEAAAGALGSFNSDWQFCLQSTGPSSTFALNVKFPQINSITYKYHVHPRSSTGGPLYTSATELRVERGIEGSRGYSHWENRDLGDSVEVVYARFNFDQNIGINKDPKYVYETLTSSSPLPASASISDDGVPIGPSSGYEQSDETVELSSGMYVTLYEKDSTVTGQIIDAEGSIVLSSSTSIDQLMDEMNSLGSTGFSFEGDISPAEFGMKNQFERDTTQNFTFTYQYRPAVVPDSSGCVPDVWLDELNLLGALGYQPDETTSGLLGGNYTIYVKGIPH